MVNIHTILDFFKGCGRGLDSLPDLGTFDFGVRCFLDSSIFLVVGGLFVFSLDELMVGNTGG